MIKVSIYFPNMPGSRFDVDYYTNVHMPLVMKSLVSAVRRCFCRNRGQWCESATATSLPRGRRLYL